MTTPLVRPIATIYANKGSDSISITDSGVALGSGATAATDSIALGSGAVATAGTVAVGSALNPLTTNAVAAPLAGAGVALPATPDGYLYVIINGTAQTIPYFPAI